MMRNSKGQFQKGNKFGKGRPTRKTEEEYLTAFSEALSIPQWKKIVKRAVKDAAAGDSKARDWVGKYTLGTNPVLTLNQYESEPITYHINWDGTVDAVPDPTPPKESSISHNGTYELTDEELMEQMKKLDDDWELPQ